MPEEEDIKVVKSEAPCDVINTKNGDGSTPTPINGNCNSENAVGPHGDVIDSPEDKSCDKDILNDSDDKSNDSEYIKSEWLTQEKLSQEERESLLTQLTNLKSTFQSHIPSSDSPEDILKLRVQLREIFSELLIKGDLLWIKENQVDADLWNTLYKQPIESLTHKCRDKRNKASSIINEGKLYYPSLIHHIFKLYGPELNAMIKTSSDTKDWTSVLWPPTECEKYLPQKLIHQLKEDIDFLQSDDCKEEHETISRVDSVRRWIQDCLIHLGDLYRHESNTNNNNSARCFYLWSATIDPDYSMPNYLLAKIELARSRALPTVYHLTRCLLGVRCDSQLERDCLSDIDHFFDKLTREAPAINPNSAQQSHTGNNRKSNQNLSDLLVKAFLQYHAAIYLKKNLSQARSLWIRIFTLLPQQVEKYSSEELLQFTAVQLFTLHRETVRYNTARNSFIHRRKSVDNTEESGGKNENNSEESSTSSSLESDYSWCKLLLQSTSNLIGALCDACSVGQQSSSRHSSNTNTNIDHFSTSVLPCVVLFLIWYRLAINKGLVHVKKEADLSTDNESGESECECGAVSELCVCTLPASFVYCINTLHQYSTNNNHQLPTNKTTQSQSTRKRQLQDEADTEPTQVIPPEHDEESVKEDLDWTIIQQLPEFIKMKIYLPLPDDVEFTTRPSCNEEERMEALLHLSRVLASYHPQLLALIHSTGESKKRYHFGIGSQSIAALFTNGSSVADESTSQKEKAEKDKTPRLPGQYPRSPSPVEKSCNRLPGQYPLSPPNQKKSSTSGHSSYRGNYPNKNQKKSFIPSATQHGAAMMSAPGFHHYSPAQPYPFNAMPPHRFYPPFPPHPQIMQFGKHRHQGGMQRPRFGSPLPPPPATAVTPGYMPSYNHYPRGGAANHQQSWKSQQSRDHQYSRQPGSYNGPKSSSAGANNRAESKSQSSTVNLGQNEKLIKVNEYGEPSVSDKFSATSTLTNNDNVANQRQQRVRNRTSSGLVANPANPPSQSNDNFCDFKITRQKSLSLNLSSTSCPSSPPHNNQLTADSSDEAPKFPSRTQPAGLITNPEITRYITQQRSLVNSLDGLSAAKNISSDGTLALPISPNGTSSLNKQGLNNQNREQFQKDLPPRFSGSGPSTPLGGPTDSFVASTASVSQSISQYAQQNSDNFRGAKNSSYYPRPNNHRYPQGTGGHMLGRPIAAQSHNYESRGGAAPPHFNNFSHANNSRSSHIPRERPVTHNHTAHLAERQSGNTAASTLMQVGTWDSTVAEQLSRMNLHNSGRRDAGPTSVSGRDHLSGGGSGGLSNSSLAPAPPVVSYHSLQAPTHYPTALDIQQLSGMHHPINWFSLPSSSSNSVNPGNSNNGAQPQGNLASNANSIFSMEHYAALAAGGLDPNLGSQMDLASTASRFGLATGAGGHNGLPNAGGATGEMWSNHNRQFQRPTGTASQSSSHAASDFHHAANHFHLNSGSDMAAHAQMGPAMHPLHFTSNSAATGSGGAAGMTHFLDNWMPSGSNQSNSGVSLGSSNTVSSNNSASGANNPLWHPHPPDLFPLPMMPTESHPHQPTGGWYTVPAAHFSSPHHPAAVLNPGDAALLQHHHHQQQSAGKTAGGPLPPHHSTAGLPHW